MIRWLLRSRLLRYRFAWFAFSLLGFYLAGVLWVSISARHQITVAGPLASCAPIRDGSGVVTSYVVTLAGAPGVHVQMTPGDMSPAPPTDLCSVQVVRVWYETASLDGPLIADRMDIHSAAASGTATYATPAGRDFATAKRLTLAAWAGGVSLLSAVMLLVAIFWRHVRHLVRRKRPSRSTRPRKLPAHFTEQVTEDLFWLESVPWGGSLSASGADAAARFEQGLALVQGRAGDEEQLLRGVSLLALCPPELALVGAAEAALQLGEYDAVSYAPEAGRAALAYAERALSLDPMSVDAQIARVRALAAQAAMREPGALARANAALRVASNMDPSHPRLPLAVASLYLARRQYAPAVAALRLALTLAPSDEAAHAVHVMLARVLEQSGNLRHALHTLVGVSIDATGGSATGA